MKETFDLSDLEMLACDCLLRVGVDDATAQIVAREVALAEAAGDVASGFTALLRDIRLIRYGRLCSDAQARVATPAPAIVTIDAGHGFAAAALTRNIPEVVATAKGQGMAMVHLSRASDPGTATGVMTEIAASGLAAICVRPFAKTYAIRPMGRHVTAMETEERSMLSTLLAEAPPAKDTPFGGPVNEECWVTVLDPGVTAAERLLARLPDVCRPQVSHGITLAPELLMQIVNA